MEEVLNQNSDSMDIYLSKSTGKIASALAKAQTKMDNALRGTKNDFYNSKYAELSEIIHVSKCIGEFGLSFSQYIEQGEENYQDKLSINKTVVTVLLHESGEMIRSKYRIKPTPKFIFKDAKNKNLGGDWFITEQAVGSAITYARRYSLQSILGIAAEDDDGNAASGKGSPSAEGGTHQQRRPTLKKNPLDDMAKEIAQKMKDATKKEERAAILYTDEGSALLTKLANADKQSTVSRLKQIIEEGEE